jgi:hypothetical protein
MMDSKQRGRGLARLLALCAVLLGLFLMHGAPASAADGCHGAVPTTATAHQGHNAAAMTTAATAAMVHPVDPQIQATDGAAMGHGAQCVSTPARDRLPLPAAGLVALAVAALTALSWADRPWSLARTGRRGPPAGGRGLLLQVCIART